MKRAALLLLLAACQKETSGSDTPPVTPQPDGPPKLVIDASGMITEAVRLTANGGRKTGADVSGGPIIVDPLGDLPSGTAPTVTITNHSGEELHLSAIALPDGEPAAIDVVSDADLFIDDLIDNPLGTTAIHCTSSEIDGGPIGLVRTGELALEAGSFAGFLAVELVRSPGEDTALVVVSPDDVLLDLTGVVRDLPASSAVFAGGTISGANVDLYVESDGTYDFASIDAVGDLSITGFADERADLRALVTVAGEVEVYTNGSIDLTATHSDLRLAAIESTAGPVTLAAPDASILQIAGGVTAGTDITLTAESGAIGAVGLPLALDSAYSGAGSVSIAAGEGVFIDEVDGDLAILGVVSADAGVSISAENGSLLDAAGDPEADVQGADIQLTASSGGIGDATHGLDIYGAGIGQSQNTLQLSNAVPGVGQLLLEAGGDVFVTEVDATLRVARATSASGGVSLSVHDSVLAGENLSLEGVVTASGEIALLAGDDVMLPAGASVESSTSILIQGDAADGGDFGATVRIEGDVSAPSLVIAGGPDLDRLELATAGGVNPSGTTVVRGDASDDRFYVSAVGGPTTLEGENGADQYYVASNATDVATIAALEASSALAALSGELSQMGGLTITPGPGGNGGTRDVLFLSAETSGAPVSGTIGDGGVSGFDIGSGDITYDPGLSILIELGAFDDTVTVTSDPSPGVIQIHTGAGADTVTGCSTGCSVYAD